MKRPAAYRARCRWAVSGLLLLLVAHAHAEGRALSVSGQATADGAPITRGSSLSATTTLILGDGASTQALLHGDRHLALLGPAEVVLSPRGLRVHRARALELSAINATLRLPAGCRVEVGPAGATVRYDGTQLWVRWGEATLLRACPPASAPTLAPASQPIPPSAVARCVPRQALRRGERVALVDGHRAAPMERSAQLERYGAPPRWAPRLAVTVDELDNVQQWVAARRKQQQELAACGCTEGASSGAASSTPQAGPLSPIESNSATLWISIKGLPTGATR